MRKEVEDKCFCKYKEGRYSWIFENVRCVKPFVVKGKQGWKILDVEEIEKIKFI